MKIFVGFIRSEIHSVAFENIFGFKITLNCCFLHFCYCSYHLFRLYLHRISEPNIFKLCSFYPMVQNESTSRILFAIFSFKFIDSILKLNFARNMLHHHLTKCTTLTITCLLALQLALLVALLITFGFLFGYSIFHAKILSSHKSKHKLKFKNRI